MNRELLPLHLSLARDAEINLGDLVLRPFTFSDRDAFYQLLSVDPPLPFIQPRIESLEEAEQILVSSFLYSPLGKWAIVRESDRVVLGSIQLEKIDVSGLRAEIGYFLGRDFWGRGIMTHVLTAIISLAFQSWGMKELLLITHLDNRASQRVAEKAGFQLLRQYKGSDRHSHKVTQFRDYTINKEVFNKINRK